MLPGTFLKLNWPSLFRVHASTASLTRVAQLEGRVPAGSRGLQRGNIVAETQRGDTNQQVLERKLDAPSPLPGLRCARPTGDFERYRMHGDIGRQPLDEFRPPIQLLLHFSAVGSVHKFGNGHHRDADSISPWAARTCSRICRTLRPLRSAAMMILESRIIPSAGGFHGSRFPKISFTSSAKSESSTGALPVSSSWVLARAMHWRTVRRGGSGGVKNRDGPAPFSITTSAPRARGPGASRHLSRRLPFPRNESHVCPYFYYTLERLVADPFTFKEGEFCFSQPDTTTN